MGTPYKYIQTVIRMFSKFAICVLLQNKEARALVDHVFLKYGLCHLLLSDQGLEFENKILASRTAIFGVNKIHASGYRPKSNAICKVVHRVLNNMFAKCVKESRKNWVGWLPYIIFFIMQLSIRAPLFL